jgi:hypothetical protein
MVYSVSLFWHIIVDATKTIYVLLCASLSIYDMFPSWNSMVPTSFPRLSKFWNTEKYVFGSSGRLRSIIRRLHKVCYKYNVDSFHGWYIWDIPCCYQSLFPWSQTDKTRWVACVHRMRGKCCWTWSFKTDRSSRQTLCNILLCLIDSFDRKIRLLCCAVTSNM